MLFYFVSGTHCIVHIWFEYLGNTLHGNYIRETQKIIINKLEEWAKKTQWKKDYLNILKLNETIKDNKDVAANVMLSCFKISSVWLKQNRSFSGSCIFTFIL